MTVDRAQVMAYRVAALGLAERVGDRPGDLPLLDLGVQAATPGSVQVALAARTSAGPADDRLVTVWAARGAPHLHRRADLPRLARALWPFSDADATARIQSGQIPEGMKLGVAAFTATAEAMRTVVTTSMPRGAVSTAVSRLVPRSLTYECGPCRARHIAGTVWQHSGLPGGVQVESRGKDAALGPIPDWPGVPTRNDGVEDLIRLYLTMLGPATAVEVAKYLGSSAAEIRKRWPDDLAEVRVDGRTAWLPRGSLASLTSAETVPGVRLLPAMDPLLQARDRDVLVPDRSRQKEIWKMLGNPGVVLVDGEIGGVWRAKTAGRRRIDLTVTPFAAMDARVRRAVEAEAGHVARARDVADATVTHA